MAPSKPTNKSNTKIVKVKRMSNKKKAFRETDMDHEFVQTCKKILPPPKDYSWVDLKEEEFVNTFNEKLFKEDTFNVNTFEEDTFNDELFEKNFFFFEICCEGIV